MEPTPDRTPVSELTDDEAWELLASQRVGRLATAAAGMADIFPVSFAVDDRSILFRTTPGSKLVELTVNSEVAFEADEIDESTARSVVLRGLAQVVEEDEAVLRAEQLLPRTFSGEDDKDTWVRITPMAIRGRRLTRG
ncbi:pyridoxamine 5'-phosphate oxidase family protein [Antribacter gilvus]|uniref:pyridoxamine 5'-phosphate oxidase family protein n=1 Tax=Antribacter gilvus TaxID=2304675 RepID=UPI000F7B5FE1|nr:pyridoxamine 5'-phosphate oxidase family protein [Antribacter gilvus]